jgi:formamidopyrimidine-DNA glycosylase
MPEIPDIEVFSYNLKDQYRGAIVKEISIIDARRLEDTQEELSAALTGASIDDVYRSGKEFRFRFSNGAVMGLHLMLTGDIRQFQHENTYKSTVVEILFTDGRGIVLTDRMKNAKIRLDPVDKDGVDAMEVDYKYLRQILNSKRPVKNILLDQDMIRGIGNGYSDEILWETRISPFAIAGAIPDEKVKELAKTIKKLLKDRAKLILKNHPGLITGEVKDYHVIHNTKKTVSPTGLPIQIKKSGGRKTYFTEEQVLYK